MTLFVDFCIGEPHQHTVNKGRIFSKFGVYVRKRYDMREKETSDIRKSILEMGGPEESEKFVRVNYWKILGVCPVCLNVWLSFVTFAVVFYYYQFDISRLFYLLPFISISNFIVRLRLRV